MRNGTETIRELNAEELDLVGGGLTVGAGASIDVSGEFNAVHGAVAGAVDKALGLVNGILGKL